MKRYLLWKKVVVAISLTAIIGGSVLTECSIKVKMQRTATKESKETAEQKTLVVKIMQLKMEIQKYI